jgi:diguanylate cyclase (GGDEF)-like protein
LTPTDTILVADDDWNFLDVISIHLEGEGFRVVTAHDGDEALRLVFDLLPSLVLLDMVMPKIDGFEVCKRLGADLRTAHIPVVALTGSRFHPDQIGLLEGSLDDYITKPVALVDLTTRIRLALNRARTGRAVSPLTQLPGNVHIQDELVRRLQDGELIGLMHIDLDNFKAFNDHYGFLRGDEAIKLLARISREAVENYARAAGFLGHIGGDDLAAIVPADRAEAIGERIVEAWDAAAEALYDPDDLSRGEIMVRDRQGILRSFPPVTVSIGVASNAVRPLKSHWEASEIAAEMKSVAKSHPESFLAVDRRREIKLDRVGSDVCDLIQGRLSA